MVALNHAELWQTKYFHKNGLLPGWLSAGEAGVDLFFVISGFIMMYVTPRAFRGWRDQAAFLIRRFVRIYPAYWGIAIPLILVWLVYPKLIGTSQGNRIDVISSLLLNPSPLAPVLVVAWTLTYELYFYIVASFLFYLAGRGRIAVAAIWFVTLVIANLIYPQTHYSPWIDLLLSPLSLEFITGMALAQILQIDSIRVSTGVAIGLFISVLLFSFVAGVHHGRFVAELREPIRYLIYGLPAGIVVWLILKMEIQHQWRWPAFLVWLGNRSYSIYLLHAPILACLFLLASKWLANSGSLEIYAVTFAIILFLFIPAALFYRLIERPSHNLAKRWSRYFSQPA